MFQQIMEVFGFWKGLVPLSDSCCVFTSRAKVAVHDTVQINSFTNLAKGSKHFTLHGGSLYLIVPKTL